MSRAEPQPKYMHINQVRIGNPNDPKLQKVANDLAVLNDNCDKAENLINDPNADINSPTTSE